MKTRAIDFLGIATIFLWIISFAIMFTINFTPLYSFDVNFFNIPDQVGLSSEVIMENYHILLDYLNKPWVSELNMPDFSSSESGLFHFYEVKRLFLLDYGILIGTTIGSFFYLRYLKRSKRNWVLLRPFMWGIFAPTIILFLIAANFNQLFVLFHQAFFNNDAWIFNPATDPIILALPESFFMHCFVLAFVLIQLLITGVYFYAKKTAFK
ncbi:TIGR01906 family membrane protein [Desemzia sp. RIT804]|uniref:TIGR01906 family membrane protein n=1 Tax=Desemzia sp. RIT 804 TaxID=2810209 RepID=UPI0019516B70|nr:TIGR01906 family membrane protein [Desemzia sp. RIT 804]MBM6615778.1 TIGR01906 family membrane protein [Desemzia sp. RIT 804]